MDETRYSLRGSNLLLQFSTLMHYTCTTWLNFVTARHHINLLFESTFCLNLTTARGRDTLLLPRPGSNLLLQFTTPIQYRLRVVTKIQNLSLLLEFTTRVLPDSIPQQHEFTQIHWSNLPQIYSLTQIFCSTWTRQDAASAS